MRGLRLPHATITQSEWSKRELARTTPRMLMIKRLRGRVQRTFVADDRPPPNPAKAAQGLSQLLVHGGSDILSSRPEKEKSAAS